NPLHELRQRLVRLEVEEADQVDEQEHGEECEQHGGRARHARGERRERERGEERDRQQVRERDRAADVPVHLLERDAEERREEEPLRELHAFPPTEPRQSHGSVQGGTSRFPRDPPPRDMSQLMSPPPPRTPPRAPPP